MKHLGFCSILKHLYHEHVYLGETFAAAADFKLLVGKAKTHTCQELLRAPSLQATVPNFCSGDRYESISQETLGYTYAML